MNHRDIKKIPITWTANKSQAIFCGDYRNIGLTIVGTGTITAQGTKQKNDADTPPDFTASSTITNSFATIVIADETAVNTYATSLAVAGATKLGEINTNLLTWVSLSRSADTVDAFITVTDNE